MAIEGFDDLDEMFLRMRKDQERADAQVRPWQVNLEAGDYCRRIGPGFLIYHQILPDPEERPAGLENYRFTRGYSVACPDGELGDIHVSTVERRLSQEQFETARARRWDP